MKKLIKVYIAGALNSDAIGYIKNMHRMIEWADKVRSAGFCVYVPCVDFLIGLQIGDYEYNDYFDNGQPWLEVSDCIFLVPGWENSKGTQMEIARANELGIPVFNNLENLMLFKNKLD
jgi:hypothetical protein